MKPHPRQSVSFPQMASAIAWHTVCTLVVTQSPCVIIAAEDDRVVKPSGSRQQSDVVFQINAQQADQYFESMVFGTVDINGRVVNGDRARIDQLIEENVEGIAEKYGLDEEKQNRLKLAAHADILRFDREFDELRERFRKLPKTQANLTQISQEITELRQKIRPLLGPESFFAKASRVILAGVVISDRGTETVDALILENGVTIDPFLRQHRETIESVVRAINWHFGSSDDRHIRLTPGQRRNLMKLLMNETHAARIAGICDDRAVKYRFSQLPEDKLKPLFEADQWPNVLLVVNAYREFKPVAVQRQQFNFQLIPRVQPADAAAPVNRGKG